MHGMLWVEFMPVAGFTDWTRRRTLSVICRYCAFTDLENLGPRFDGPDYLSCG